MPTAVLWQRSLFEELREQRDAVDLRIRELERAGDVLDEVIVTASVN